MTKRPSIIAVDLTPILPGGENGGAKIFTLDLIRRLADIDPATQFILLTQSASHDELASMDGINVRRLMVLGPVEESAVRSSCKRLASRVLPHVPARLRGFIARLGNKLLTLTKRHGHRSLLVDLGVELLFCPFTAPTFLEQGIPTVSTIYDLQYKTYPEFFSAGDVAHREQVFLDACRKATALAAISDYSRDSAIEHGNLDPDRIRTIHLRMAHRTVTEQDSNDAVLQRLGLTPKRFLVYPANFWRHKNHEMLLTAFGLACHKGLPSDIKLVCTGSPGPRHDWLKRAAKIMNLADRVLFPGYLPSGELATLMTQCSGVIFPSLYEGFGLPVIEAMAAGVPVACSNTTSLPEVAADAAILFDPRVPTQIAQSITALIDNEPLRERLIEAGRQRAEEFEDTTRMAREYWDLFLYALANQRHENLLTGAYTDGWIGPRLNLQVAPANSAQTLEIELQAPDWLPQSSVTATTFRGGKKQKPPIVLQRGTSAHLSWPIGSSGAQFEVLMHPTFVPADSEMGEDCRKLSVLLRSCSLQSASGERVVLFPEETV